MSASDVRTLVEYLITTKTADGPKLGSLQRSRDEAAGFWRDLMEAHTGAGDWAVGHVLDLMSAQEHEQEGDPHSHGHRRVYTLEAPGGGFPLLLWSENAGDTARESSDLTLLPADEHRSAVGLRQRPTRKGQVAIVPGDTLPLLREALRIELVGAGEGLGSVSTARATREDWLEPLGRIDRARALMDEIGWREVDLAQDVKIDLDSHREALEDALGEQLETERYLAAEDGPAARGQRERSRGYIATIEAFAGSVGLDLNRSVEPDDKE